MGDEYGLESNFISTHSGWDEIEVANLSKSVGGLNMTSMFV